MSNTNEEFGIVISNHDFAARDSKGRAIGARIETFEIDAEFEGVWNSKAKAYLIPGPYYGFRPWATRNGHTYGAVQPRQFFATPETRDKAVITYLRGAQTRADKQFLARQEEARKTIRDAQQREEENAEIASISALNDDSYDPPVA